MKKHYVITVLILSVSVLLLGFSYAKESGTNDVVGMTEELSNDYRVIYSAGDVGTIENNKIDVSLINKQNKKITYYLNLTEVNDEKYEGVSVKISGNDKEQAVTNGYVKLATLNEYGTDGDHVTVSLEFMAKNNYTFKMKVVAVDESLLSDVIKFSGSVYTDSKENIRYYGANVNNYVVYRNIRARIVGIIGNKIRLVSDNEGSGLYEINGRKYLTIDDYLGSFNNNKVTINNAGNYNTWLGVNNYWLESSDVDQAYYVDQNNGVFISNRYYYRVYRYVYEIDINSKIVKGNGIANNPYEVSYGS